MFRPLRICTWNAQGLEQKGPELCLIVETHDVDICLLSETKLADDTPFEVDGYNLYRACHPVGPNRQGGAAVLVRKTIAHVAQSNIVWNCNSQILNEPRWHRRTNVVCFQIARIELELFDNMNYQIGAFYAPAGHPVPAEYFQWVFKQMGSHFLLGGDYNGHHPSWDGDRDASSANSMGRQLYAAIQQENLEIMAPKFYTFVPHNPRHRASILDFFIGKHVKCMCDDPRSFVDCTSDHKPVLVNMWDQRKTNVSATTSAQSSRHGQSQQVTSRSAVPPIPPESASHKPWLRATSSTAIPPAQWLENETSSRSTGLSQPPTSQSRNAIRDPSADNNLPLLRTDMAANNGVKVCFWDAQGLSGKEHELYQLLEEMDILMISQTLPFPQDLEIRDHKMYRADHPFSSKRGGSAILVRQEIEHSQRSSITADFVQMSRINVRIHNKLFQFASMHFHPEDDVLKLEHYNFVFEDILTFPNLGFLVGGGFNAKHELWNCSNSDNRGLHLVEFIREHHLNVIVPSRPTFYPNTGLQAEVMDFFIGKCLPNLVRIPLLRDSASEHKPIHVELMF